MTRVAVGFYIKNPLFRVARLLVIAALMVMVGMPSGGMAQVPLVYDVEHTGTNFPAPPLPTMANLPIVQPLPDPFAWASDPFGGTRSTNFTDWSHHRAEIKGQIENYGVTRRRNRPEPWKALRRPITIGLAKEFSLSAAPTSQGCPKIIIC